MLTQRALMRVCTYRPRPEVARYSHAGIRRLASGSGPRAGPVRPRSAPGLPCRARRSHCASHAPIRRKGFALTTSPAPRAESPAHAKLASWAKRPRCTEPDRCVLSQENRNSRWRPVGAVVDEREGAIALQAGIDGPEATGLNSHDGDPVGRRDPDPPSHPTEPPSGRTPVVDGLADPLRRPGRSGPVRRWTGDGEEKERWRVSRRCRTCLKMRLAQECD